MATEERGDLVDRGSPILQNVLVVDDDPDVVHALRELLSARGYRVMTAKDGGQAHSNFVMNRPDIVLLDLILPGESGFEVCERMKQTDETVPVVVLSVIDMDDARELAQRVGAAGYLTKPIAPEDLLAELSKVAAGGRQEPPEAHSGERERIRFKCRCGKRFKVSPVHRGRTMTCPDCGEPLVVPRHS